MSTYFSVPKKINFFRIKCGHNSTILVNIIVNLSLKVSFICLSDTDTGIDFLILILSNTFDTFNMVYSHIVCIAKCGRLRQPISIFLQNTSICLFPNMAVHYTRNEMVLYECFLLLLLKYIWPT